MRPIGRLHATFVAQQGGARKAVAHGSANERAKVVAGHVLLGGNGVGELPEPLVIGGVAQVDAEAIADGGVDQAVIANVEEAAAVGGKVEVVASEAIGEAGKQVVFAEELWVDRGEGEIDRCRGRKPPGGVAESGAEGHRSVIAQGVGRTEDAQPMAAAEEVPQHATIFKAERGVTGGALEENADAAFPGELKGAAVPEEIGDVAGRFVKGVGPGLEIGEEVFAPGVNGKMIQIGIKSGQVLGSGPLIEDAARMTGRVEIRMWNGRERSQALAASRKQECRRSGDGSAVEPGTELAGDRFDTAEPSFDGLVQNFRERFGVVFVAAQAQARSVAGMPVRASGQAAWSDAKAVTRRQQPNPAEEAAGGFGIDKD